VRRGYDYVVGQRGTCNELAVLGHVEYCAKRHPRPIATFILEERNYGDEVN
jgi:hypothetical protein